MYINIILTDGKTTLIIKYIKSFHNPKNQISFGKSLLNCFKCGVLLHYRLNSSQYWSAMANYFWARKFPLIRPFQSTIHIAYCEGLLSLIKFNWPLNDIEVRIDCDQILLVMNWFDYEDLTGSQRTLQTQWQN